MIFENAFLDVRKGAMEHKQLCPGLNNYFDTREIFRFFAACLTNF
ncbi:hypothetical protein NIASO_13280 [Niabella soli DSM 19437]|uniref:Uncharacterized protein n=1 Tax=Niabella soli DSM 19437 TaxID=929713 RepID=W0F7F8_9BACT|nr:hypothetical protein NIASO_13280 [Niabella soli DSM 19437]